MFRNVLKIAAVDKYILLNRIHKNQKMCQKIVDSSPEIFNFNACISSDINASVIVTILMLIYSNFHNLRNSDEITQMAFLSMMH